MTAVYDWMRYHSRNAPEKTALIDHASGREWCYRTLNERCDQLAGFLASQYVGRGDRVAILTYNCCEMLELLFACQKLGAIYVPLNWRLAEPELRAILEDCEPTVLIAGDEFTEVASSLERALGATLITMRYGAESAYEQGIRDAEPIASFADQAHDDVWIIMYTSGTTGRPKGACLTHGNVIFTTLNHCIRFNLNSRSRNLTVLPLFHVGGLFLFTTPLMHMGGSAVVVREFEAEGCLELLANKELGVTHIFGVPTVFLFMSQLPAFETADLGHLEHVMVGGAPAPEELLRVYANKGVSIGQGFGMTETATTGTALARYESLEKLGSSGLPALHAEVLLVDADGYGVPTGEVGELWIRGPAISPGYWRRPDADAEAFVDRWKDMFISGGENVYPAEIENVIYQHPDIAEVAVIGIADSRWGEVGCAFVVPRPGKSLSAEPVLEQCRNELARYKVPKEVVVIDSIPHNAAGKVVKPALREYYRDNYSVQVEKSNSRSGVSPASSLTGVNRPTRTTRRRR